MAKFYFAIGKFSAGKQDCSAAVRPLSAPSSESPAKKTSAAAPQADISPLQDDR